MFQKAEKVVIDNPVVSSLIVAVPIVALAWSSFRYVIT
jgi:hypothetical protein